jgi:hypothetical protein
MTVSNTVSHEPITCPSCEYRYSSGNTICPMCETAALVVEPLQTLSRIPDEFSGADYQSRPSSSDSQQSPHHPGLRRLVPVVVVLIGLMVVTSFFFKVRKGNQPKESGSAVELTATSGQPKLENAGKRNIVHNPVRGVQHAVAAKPETAQTTSAAKEDDPVELWKAVKRGNMIAEVALANLYLEGKAVSQNCEQAHVLLQTASMKGSKAADTLLKGSYAETCE